LLEGMQLSSIFEMLEQALTWIDGATELSSNPWYEGLKARIKFRKSWLRVLSEPLPNSAQYIAQALRFSTTIQTERHPVLATSSPHRLAFDHAVSRDLPSFLPLPIVEPFGFDETWKRVMAFLEGKRLLVLAFQNGNLLQWQTMANICSWTGSPKWPPYIRSLAMTLICSDNDILGVHTSTWAVDQFFYDIAQLLYGSLFKAAEAIGTKEKSQKLVHRLNELEKRLAKAVIRFYLSCFHSRSRQRREFANDVEEWQILYDECNSAIASLSQAPGNHTIRQKFPLAIQYHRLRMIQEVMLSGFELKLYSRHELAFAYWYSISPIREQRKIIDDMKEIVKDRSHEMDYLRYQSKFLEVLEKLLNTFARLSCHQPSDSQITPNRIRLNLQRRFKWAFGEGYDSLSFYDPATPDYDGFELWQEGVYEESDWLLEVRKQLAEALRVISRLEDMELLPRHLSLCSEEHETLLAHLRNVCEEYLANLANWSVDRPVKFYWPPEIISWFPNLQ